MKTTLPQQITTIDEAKAFMRSLHENGELFSPDDDTHHIEWDCEPPTFAECDKLNQLMNEARNVEGFDPWAFGLPDPAQRTPVAQHHQRKQNPQAAQVMILQITDTNTGTKKFFAGIYRDGSPVWTTHENLALDKKLIDLLAVVNLFHPDNYVIRERIAHVPSLHWAYVTDCGWLLINKS